MSNQHRRSIQWLVRWRPLFLVAALLVGAFAASCEETGPSPVGVHPNDAGKTEQDTGAGGDAAEEAGEADAESEAGEDAGEEAGQLDAGDAGDAHDADADAFPF
jgi:hypothetical protein